jgi:hypothetical protein
MFGSTVLEVATGLALVYLTFSLFCSALSEWVARALRLRARTLRPGINALLQDPAGAGLAKALHDHPLISGLNQESGWRWVNRLQRFSDYPAYIPSRTFASAIMDLAVDVPALKPDGSPQDAAAIKSSVDVKAHQMLASIIRGAETDATAVRQRLEDWFDDSMERLSGWYKRRTQLVLVAIAAILVVGLDIDTIRIAEQLQRDGTFRAALVKQADALVQQHAGSTPDSTFRKHLADLEGAKLPIGWPHGCNLLPRGEGCGVSWSVLVGLVLSVIALSLGAPFWFDALNKLVNLRQTGVPPDELPRRNRVQKQRPGATSNGI